MEPTFSEFSYGFAVTNEFAGLLNLSVAPIFPSLLEEGKAGGGYDVKFDKPGLPLFLQFKRSERMILHTAREFGLRGCSITLPYHRFPITPSSKSRQHRMLLNLDTPNNRVYYVAPRFHRVEHLNDAWQAQEVLARSLFLPPRSIGPMPDSGKHSIAFDDHSVWRCSEPMEIKGMGIEHVLMDLQEDVHNRKEPLRDEIAEWHVRLDEARKDEFPLSGYEGPSAIEAVTPEQIPGPRDMPPMRSPKETDSDRLALQRVADRAQIEFDAQLFVVQEATKAS